MFGGYGSVRFFEAYGIDSPAELSLSTDSCVEVILNFGCPLLDPISTSPEIADGAMTNNDGDRGASHAKTRTDNQQGVHYNYSQMVEKHILLGRVDGDPIGRAFDFLSLRESYRLPIFHCQDFEIPRWQAQNIEVTMVLPNGNGMENGGNNIGK